MNFSFPVISLSVRGKTSPWVSSMFGQAVSWMPSEQGRVTLFRYFLPHADPVCRIHSTWKHKLVILELIQTKANKAWEAEHGHTQRSCGRHPKSPHRHQSTLLLPTAGPQPYQTDVLQQQVSFRILYLFTSGSFPLVSSSHCSCSSQPAAATSSHSPAFPAWLCVTDLFAPPSYSLAFPLQSEPEMALATGTSAPRPRILTELCRSLWDKPKEKLF